MVVLDKVANFNISRACSLVFSSNLSSANFVGPLITEVKRLEIL